MDMEKIHCMTRRELIDKIIKMDVQMGQMEDKIQYFTEVIREGKVIE